MLPRINQLSFERKDVSEFPFRLYSNFKDWSNLDLRPPTLKKTTRNYDKWARYNQAAEHH